MINRKIPTTGEEIPVIGLGTWQTFDVGTSDRERRPLTEVLDTFGKGGGKVIDSSPMYGRAEGVVGDLKSHVPGAFIATKVWTRGRDQGIEQMTRSMQLFGVERIDLMQVHNLVDWRTHLDTMRDWKRRGRIRYLGVTHYQSGAFPQLASIMSEEEIDFVQLPYSITLPDAEARLLPLAQERGIAVLVNRPFDAGSLFRNARTRTLPPWAAEFGSSWAEVFLRWIVSHPAITCVIPATHNPAHMAEDLKAGDGPLMTQRQRDELRKRVVAEIPSPLAGG
ncbi:MAG TPA: aldo/keto reductase [Thermoanaerobaculia bacterium]|nr:aldo/keto reductase [Thermoanaerobaculia bacterium]